MSSRYARAEAITLERLDEIFGHETAHLERWQQYAIAAKCFMHFADIVGEIAIEMNSARPTQETPAEPPRPGCEEWWHLKQYGYAPGGYIITCFDCKQKVWDCDKRASICRPCAEKRHASKARSVPTVTTIDKCDNCGVLTNDPNHFCKQL